MKTWVHNIQKQMVNMTRKEKVEYLLTYYWHYMLGIVAFVSLGVLLIYHFCFNQKEVLYTCIMINQRIDYERDAYLGEALAGVLAIDKEKVVVEIGRAHV